MDFPKLECRSGQGICGQVEAPARGVFLGFVEGGAIEIAARPASPGLDQFPRFAPRSAAL